MTIVHAWSANLVVALVAIATLVVGGVSVWTSASMTRRLGGVLVAQICALTAATALGAPNAVVAAGVAAAAAHIVVGAAVLVLLAEAYGTVEAAELDAADANAESESARVR